MSPDPALQLAAAVNRRGMAVRIDHSDVKVWIEGTRFLVIRRTDRGPVVVTVRRQTTPGPGSLIDKATKGKRARKVPIIEEARELVAARLDVVRDDDGRLFTAPPARAR